MVGIKNNKTAASNKDSLIKRLGPGLITGASDDDPSGIGTYSQAGAQLGFGISWTMLLTYPLMVAIQEISGRIGRVTGHGIAGNVCRNFPAPFIWSLIVLLLVANTVNIAADLGAMADATKLLVGGWSPLYVVVYAVGSVTAQVFLSYKRYVGILKWLTLVLFAYVIALAVVHVPWGEAIRGLLIPKVEFNGAFLTTLIAILGTTISPYLFVWQSSQEAEEQRIDPDKRPLRESAGSGKSELWRIRLDTLVGMAFSNHPHSHPDPNPPDPSQQGHHRHPDIFPGRAGAQTRGRRLCRIGVCARDHRHRPSRRSGPGRLDGLRHRRRTQMAGGPGAQAEGSDRVLYGPDDIGGICRGT